MSLPLSLSAACVRYLRSPHGKALSWRERDRLAYEVVKSVNFLHRFPAPHGPILHRDIKSLNFLLDDHLHVKVADFGLSKLQHTLSTLSTAVTRSAQSLMGTLQWMAPELLDQDTAYSDKCDVFSIGVVLWELATGKTPWEGMTFPAVAGALVVGRRLAIPEGTPAHFRAWIQACWDKEPTLRPSCLDLLILIEQHIDADRRKRDAEAAQSALIAAAAATEAMSSASSLGGSTASTQSATSSGSSGAGRHGSHGSSRFDFAQTTVHHSLGDSASLSPDTPRTPRAQSKQSSGAEPPQAEPSPPPLPKAVVSNGGDAGGEMNFRYFYPGSESEVSPEAGDGFAMRYDPPSQEGGQLSPLSPVITVTAPPASAVVSPTAVEKAKTLSPPPLPPLSVRPPPALPERSAFATSAPPPAAGAGGPPGLGRSASVVVAPPPIPSVVPSPSARLSLPNPSKPSPPSLPHRRSSSEVMASVGVVSPMQRQAMEAAAAGAQAQLLQRYAARMGTPPTAAAVTASSTPTFSSGSPSSQQSTPSPVSSPTSAVHKPPVLRLHSSLDWERHHGSLVHRGVVADVWAGRSSLSSWRRQWVWWEPPLPGDGLSRVLGVVYWADYQPSDGPTGQRRAHVDGHQMLPQEVSDVFVNDLAACAHSPFIARNGPAPAVTLAHCLSVRTERSTFHLQFEGAGVKDEWVKGFLAVLHARKYITEGHGSALSSPQSSASESELSALTPHTPSTPSALAHLYTPATVLTSHQSPVQYVAAPQPVPAMPPQLDDPSTALCEYSPSADWGGARLLAAPFGHPGELVVVSQDGRRTEAVRGVARSALEGKTLLALSWHEKSQSLFCLAHRGAEVQVLRMELHDLALHAVTGVKALPGVSTQLLTSAVHVACSPDGRLLFVNLGFALLMVSFLERGEDAVVETLVSPRSSSGAMALTSLTLSAFGQFVFALDASDAKGSALMWNVHNRSVRRVLLRFVTRPVGLALLRGTGAMVVVGADGAVAVMDMAAAMKAAPATLADAVRQHPLDMQHVPHCLMGRFWLMAEDVSTAQPPAARPGDGFRVAVSTVAVLGAAEGAVATFAFAQDGRLALRRWLIAPAVRDPPPVLQSPSSTSAPAPTKGVSHAPMQRTSLTRLKNLAANADGEPSVVCAYQDASVDLLLVYVHRKAALYVVDCARLSMRKLAPRLPQPITALCYEPVRERLYVCWAGRLQHFSFRRAEWPALLSKGETALSSGSQLLALPSEARALITDSHGRFVYAALRDRVIRVAAEGGAKFEFAPPNAASAELSSLALLHGEATLVALDTRQRMLWRWRTATAECLDLAGQLLITEASSSAATSSTAPRLVPVLSTRLAAFDPSLDVVLLAGPDERVALWTVPPAGRTVWHRHWKAAVDTDSAAATGDARPRVPLFSRSRASPTSADREDAAITALCGRVEPGMEATTTRLSALVVQAGMCTVARWTQPRSA